MVYSTESSDIQPQGEFQARFGKDPSSRGFQCVTPTRNRISSAAHGDHLNGGNAPSRTEENTIGVDHDQVDARASRHTMKNLIGRNFAHYTLTEELGHGGQGCVYKAKDRRLGRNVALKILTANSMVSRSARMRFLREAELASKINDPGICTIHEYGEYNGIPFIAMQLVEGQPLSRVIANSREGEISAVTMSHVFFDDDDEAIEEKSLPSATGQNSKTPAKSEILAMLAFIEETARALHVAHSGGLIHRDIKPANIMAADDGRPVILDFGLARDDSPEFASLTESGAVMGTPAYMSPESLKGQRGRIDPRTDVYSLGVTLYECLTSRRPFTGSTRAALDHAISHSSAPDPRRLNREIPNDLRIVIETAMEKDLDRRYPSALEFAEDLRRVRECKPIEARSAGPILKFRRLVQRNTLLAASCFLLVVVMTLSVSILVAQQQKLDESESQVRALRQLLDGQSKIETRTFSKLK